MNFDDPYASVKVEKKRRKNKALKEKVEELNVEVAEFGEEYQAEVKDLQLKSGRWRCV